MPEFPSRLYKPATAILPLSLLLAQTAFGAPASEAPLAATTKLTYAQRVGAGLSRVSDEPRLSRGMLITSLTQDASGNLYVASEDAGIWRRDAKGSWGNLTLQNAILRDEMITAIAFDTRGRLWAGTAHSGVAVWNGRRWRNFSALEGAGGEHIFDIAQSPRGEMWLATNEGIALYNSQTDRWSLHVAAGRVSLKNIQAIAFAPNGNVVLGAQSNGVLVGTPGRNNEYSYRHTRAVSDFAPKSPGGSGLPSNMINNVLVTHDTIYAATMCGVAQSRDNGRHWRYVRGRDYVAKVEARNRLKIEVQKANAMEEMRSGVFRKPSSKRAPQLEIPASLRDGQRTLREDAANTLATDASGRIFVGYRGKSGYEVWNRDFTQRLFDGANDIPNAIKGISAPGGYVSSILPTPNGEVMLGTYGNGLIAASARVASTKRTSSTRYWRDVALPSPAGAPSLQELNALLAQLERVPTTPEKVAPVVALSDDWATRGEWLGRYGRYWANLAAMLPASEGFNFIYRAGDRDVANRNFIGENPHQAMRYYVAELYNDKPESLEMPSVFLDGRVRAGYTTWKKGRRQSEMNDYTDTYKPFEEGLNTYSTLRIPPGRYVLSVYCNNKDGAWWDNRLRDYRVSVRLKNPNSYSDEVENFSAEPEAARSRIRDFRNGVWKRFLVQGPQTYTVELNRNYGFMVTFNAITLDRLDEMPAPYFQSWEQQRVLDEAEQAAKLYRNFANPPQENSRRAQKQFLSRPAPLQRQALMLLWLKLSSLRKSNPAWALQNSRPFDLAFTRAILKDSELKNISAQAVATMAASGFYNLRLFDNWESLQDAIGLTPARSIEKALRWDGVTDRIDARKLVEGYARKNKINGYSNEESYANIAN